jgi:hypothetical protein
MHNAPMTVPTWNAKFHFLWICLSWTYKRGILSVILWIEENQVLLILYISLWRRGGMSEKVNSGYYSSSSLDVCDKVTDEDSGEEDSWNMNNLLWSQLCLEAKLHKCHSSDENSVYNLQINELNTISPDQETAVAADLIIERLRVRTISLGLWCVRS